jgi:primosomal protein N' (replication factor Y)
MDSATLYTDVILPIPVQQTFTYHVPNNLEDRVQLGCRVVVQFGNRKYYSAIVKRIHRDKPNYETKPIEVVLDETPIISQTCFPFWEWISSYYLCSEGEVMKAALPSGLKLESQTDISINSEWIEDENEKLTPTESSVFEFISSQKKASIQQINSLTKRMNAYPVIKSLLQKGAVSVEETVTESYRPKTVAHIKLSAALCDAEALEKATEQLKRAQKQLDLLLLIIDELHFFSSNRKPFIPKKELLQKSKSTEGVLKGLCEKGFIEIIAVETDRLSDKEKSTVANQLNYFQEQALREITTNFASKNVTLLHGVTASGKTEIYIRMIEEQLKAGKQVLYLLPEIALTSQIIDRLTTVFGNKAGVYHSKFNDAERVEIWNKVLVFEHEEHPKYQLILGARSALLLPFSNLGLIIIDEEHENSFKQFDPAPRYNARDAAIVLANLHQAKVLLGSATPSFESYFNAKAEKYGYVSLTHRHHEIELPEIIVADIRDAYKRKQMKSHFTPTLFQHIQMALENNEQILLFQNRRGFSPFIQCRNCGWIPKCQHCDVSLTYHKYHNNLQCHYCGFSQQLPSACPDCHSADVQTKGFGTEKIEDDLGIYFPNVKVGRLDLDATRLKMGYQQVLEKFASGKTQILVGTQMVTKGLDFENVSLVGILNADNLLNFPDFRSYERSYQLMAQVSGRAGRKNKKGKVIIQTSQPEHPIISLVQQNNYEGLFNTYINERKLFRYPPWFRLINITIKHKNSERAQAAAHQLSTELRKVFHSRILGPEFHLISRVQQYYQLIIRIKMERNLAPSEAKKEIVKSIDRVKQNSLNSAIIFSIDVDPY